MANFFWRKNLIGTASSLDTILTSEIQTGDSAIVIDGNNFYLLEYDSTDVQVENSPYIIKPNSGGGSWLLQKFKLDFMEEGTDTKILTATERSNLTNLSSNGESTLHYHDGRYYTETEIDSLLNTYGVDLNKNLGTAINADDINYSGKFVAQFSLNAPTTEWAVLEVLYSDSDYSIQNWRALGTTSDVEYTRTCNLGVWGDWILQTTTSPLTDNAIPKADSISGRLQDSGVIIDDYNNVAGAGTQTNIQSGTTYTLALTDKGKLVTLNNVSAIILTIPTNVSVAFPIGTVINILQLGVGQVTVSSSDTLLSKDSNTKLTGQYSAGSLVKIADTTWVLFGDLAA